MELGPAERKKDDECEGARPSPSSSPSCEDAVAGADKEMPKQQQQQGASGNDDEEEEDDDEGTRQPYKCTFCRRGFPTAQALGGHMNVHRRQRTRPAAAAAAAAAAASTGTGGAASVVYDYDYDQPCSTSTTMTTAPVLAFAQQATMTRPAPVAGVAALHAQRKPHELLPLFSRGSGSGAAAARDVREDRYFAAVAEEGDNDGGEELDLELRLGGAGS